MEVLMFRGILQKIVAQSRVRVSNAPPQQDGDPIKARTEWTPAKGGGANFCTHKLVQIDSNRVEFRPSAGAIVFYLIFLLVGLGIGLGATASNILKGTLAFNQNTILPVVFGAIFAAAGGAMLYYGTAPIVFDKRHGYFWKGRKNPDEVADKRSLKHFAMLNDIHALQLVAERCTGKNSSYYSYELNLVLNDASRINVIDHGNLKRIQEDTATLATFLDQPVWSSI